MKPHGQWSVWAHLTLKRRSLATISPSLRHPLLLDLSSTSHSLRTSGSFSRLTLVDRSAQSDMATSGGTLSSRPLTTIKSRTRRLLPGRHTYRFGFSPHTRTHTHTHTHARTLGRRRRRFSMRRDCSLRLKSTDSSEFKKAKSSK